MPFLELKYIKRSKTSKKQAQKTLGYNADKKKEEGRILFNQKGEPMTEEEAFAKIVGAPQNVLFWKMILSPDVKSENIEKSLDLWLLTEKLVDYLKEKLNRDIPLIGAIHNNTDNPHVHAILLIERHGWEMLITKPMIEEMKAFAAEQAFEQQRDRKRMQKARELGAKRGLRLGADRAKTTGREITHQAVYAKPLCPVCADGKAMGMADTPDRCPACGRDLKREYSHGLSF